MDLYREQLLDHYRNPRGWGLKKGIKHTQVGYNPMCGDQMTVQVELENEKIKAMYFEGHGCVISIAAASLLSDYIVGKTTDEAKKISLTDVNKLLGLSTPPTRIKCALLSLATLQDALK